MTSMPPREPQDLLRLTDEDNNAPRLIVVVPWDLPGTWRDWSQRFEPGPVVVSSRVGVPVTYSASRRRLREPVHRRLLNPDVRRHLVYEQAAPVHQSARGRLTAGAQPEFLAFAWDVLLLEESAVPENNPRTRALLALHLVVREPRPSHVRAWTRGLVHTSAGHAEIDREVHRVLAALSGQDDVGHGVGAVSEDGTDLSDPYTVVYVPEDHGVSAFPDAGDGEAASLRAAWEWAQLPKNDADRAFDAEPYEERLSRLHKLS